MKWKHVSFLLTVVKQLEDGEAPSTERLETMRFILDREDEILVKRSEQHRKNLVSAILKP